MALVYMVKNSAFPHLIKIGMTQKGSLEDRGLDNTSVPDDFEEIRVYEFANAKDIEKTIHYALRNYRYRENKEFFFATCAKEAIELLDRLAGSNKAKNLVDDPNDDVVMGSFELYEIPVGSILTLIEDKDIEVKTLDKKNAVEFEGEKMTVGPASVKAYAKIGQKTGGKYGFNAFAYNGIRIKSPWWRNDINTIAYQVAKKKNKK